LHFLSDVRYQVQTIILMAITPANPLISNGTLQRGRGKTKQCNPFIMEGGNTPNGFAYFGKKPK